ncbi:MAG: hypothetical protein AB1486_04565 [Planctomycetota bacterium]
MRARRLLSMLLALTACGAPATLDLRGEDVFPRYLVGRSSGTLTIDGRLSDDAWRCVPTTGPFEDGARSGAPFGSGARRVGGRLWVEARLLFDDERIVVAARIAAPLPGGANERVFAASAPGHAFGIVLDPGSGSVTEIVVRPAGGLTVRQAGPTGHEPHLVDHIPVELGTDLTRLTRVASEGGTPLPEWSFELGVPFAALGQGGTQPRAGDEWRANFWCCAELEGEVVCWAPSNGADPLDGRLGWLDFLDGPLP